MTIMLFVVKARLSAVAFEWSLGMRLGLVRGLGWGLVLVWACLLVQALSRLLILCGYLGC